MNKPLNAFLTLALSGLLLTASAAANAVLLVHYTFDDGTATDQSGNGNDGTIIGSPTLVAASGPDGSTAYSGTGAGGLQAVSGSAAGIDTSAGGTNTVAFWMNWGGTEGQMAFQWGAYDLYFAAGGFGFNTFQYGNLYGTSSAGLANNWVHVAAVFFNGNDALGSKIYLDGVEQTLSVINHSAGTANASTSFAVGSGYNSGFGGGIDDFRIYSGTLSSAEIAGLASGSSASVPLPAPAILFGLLAPLVLRRWPLKRGSTV